MELPIMDAGYYEVIAEAGNDLTNACHHQAEAMGWHEDISQLLESDLPEEVKHKVHLWYQGTKLMLAVTEVAEAMEGLRKNKMDDHLPQYPMMAVELADCVIRCFDQAGHMGFALGEIIAAKLKYNATRADHSREARNADGGKAV